MPELPDLWGEEFDAAYRAAEAEGRFVRQVPARDLYGRMMRTLAQTGNGWMTFKDAANRDVQPDRRPGQRRAPVQPVHRDRRGVQRRRDRGVQPRLGQPRPAPAPTAGVDWERLRATVRTAVTYLDRVIDINYYPSAEAAASNPRWRPVGLGVMGLQDVFFALRLPFDSAEARELSTRIAEEIYLSALEASAELAEQHGAAPGVRRRPGPRGASCSPTSGA